METYIFNIVHENNFMPGGRREDDIEFGKF